MELTNYYADIMDKVYYYIIKTYVHDTQKLVEERLTRQDLIIREEHNKSKNSNGIDFNASFGHHQNIEGNNNPTLNNSMVNGSN